MRLALKVECYSGYKAYERPLRFTLAGLNGRSYVVREILDQWYGDGYQYFKVRADDKNIYIIRHSEADDVWTLDSYRSNTGDLYQT